MGKRKILICGATGFIGRNLVDRFSGRDDCVLYGTVDRRKPDRALSEPGKIKLLKADLTNRADVERVLKGMDVVIQAAATTSGAQDIVTQPFIHVTDNAVMNSLIFRACHEQGVRHVIFFSCTVMYSENKHPVREEDFRYEIIDKYFGVGWTKVYIEKMCAFYAGLGKAKYTVIRHSNVYGPYDKYDLAHSHVFGATVTKVMTEPTDRIVVWGDGTEERDLLYVGDLIDFVDCAITKQKRPFELVNVGLGRSVSVRELVKTIIKHSGRRLKIDFDASKPTIPFKLSLNIAKANKTFGWSPKTSLARGIERTLDWYRENVMSTQAAARG